MVDRSIREDFELYHSNLCKRARVLVGEKIKKYSGEDGNPLSNFRKVEHLGICSTDIGILARIADKIGRLTSYIHSNGDRVGEESFDDAILDLINYIVFLEYSIKTQDITDAPRR